MNKGLKIFLIIIAVLLLIIAILYRFQKKVSVETKKEEKTLFSKNTKEACTIELKICANGEYVSRVLPDCEFKECPVNKVQPYDVSRYDDPNIKKMNTSNYQTYNTFESDGVSITVREIIEDSRCPVNVQCVWAGIIIIRVDINVEGVKKEAILEFGKPYYFNGKTITLIEAGVKNNYNFKFNIK